MLLCSHYSPPRVSENLIWTNGARRYGPLHWQAQQNISSVGRKYYRKKYWSSADQQEALDVVLISEVPPVQIYLFAGDSLDHCNSSERTGGRYSASVSNKTPPLGIVSWGSRVTRKLPFILFSSEGTVQSKAYYATTAWSVTVPLTCTEMDCCSSQ